MNAAPRSTRRPDETHRQARERPAARRARACRLRSTACSPGTERRVSRRHRNAARSAARPQRRPRSSAAARPSRRRSRAAQSAGRYTRPRSRAPPTPPAGRAWRHARTTFERPARCLGRGAIPTVGGPYPPGVSEPHRLRVGGPHAASAPGVNQSPNLSSVTGITSAAAAIGAHACGAPPTSTHTHTHHGGDVRPPSALRPGAVHLPARPAAPAAPQRRNRLQPDRRIGRAGVAGQSASHHP
jgi:hypothetical protein